MAKVIIKLSYNPYTGTSQLAQVCANKEIPVTQHASLSPILTDRLPRWIAPHDHWRGLFPELAEYYGTSDFEIHYLGLEEDYQLLEAACDTYARPAGISVQLYYDSSAQSRKSNSGAGKLDQVRQLRSQFPAMGLGELTEAGVVQQIFDATLNGQFEIGVVAPVSAGKSTLQNALVGRRNLPTGPRATTAVLTHTKINPALPEFQATAWKQDERVTFQPVTRALIRQLNDGMNPNAPDSGRGQWSKIQLEGPVFRHPLDRTRRFDEGSTSLILTDTPGNNNASNSLHALITQSLLEDENKSMVLFLFSAETLDNTDTRSVLDGTLKAVSKIICQGKHGKLSKDRFLFVCSHADEITESYQNCYDDIRRLLEDYGIREPNLFLVSAYTAELIRAMQRGEMLPAEQNDADRLSDRELSDAARLIAQFSVRYEQSEDFAPEINEDQALYHFSSLPEPVMREFDVRVEQLRQMTPAGQPNREVALIHSGIPALEYTIAEYIDRYATPLKIQQLHDNILRKIRDLKLVDEFQNRLLTDRQKLEDTRKEVIAKMAELNGSHSIKPYLQQLRSREYDTRNIITLHAKLKQELREKTSGMLFSDAVQKEIVQDGNVHSYTAIPRSRLDAFAAQQRKVILEQYDLICARIVEQVNTDVIAQCRQVEQKFEDYVRSLKREGIFDIAGLQIDTVGTLPPEIEQIRLDPDVEIINERIRTERVQKEGFLNAIFAFFDAPFAFEEKDIYGDVEYVSVREVYEDLLAPANDAFDRAVRDTLEESRKRVAAVKQQTEHNLTLLDDYIQSCFEAWKGKLEDAKALEKACANTSRLLNNVQTLIEQIEMILEMEE